MINTLGIIGGGVVGSATARCFMEWCDVRVYDVMKDRATHSLDDTLASDLVMISLPTPQSKDGLHSDLSYIEGFFADLAVKSKEGRFVLRSTVPIGTTKRLREKYGLDICHSPEFLTARCAITDSQLPARNIIGGCELGTMKGTTASLLHMLYSLRFKGVPIHVMTSCESEAVKLFLNSFFAVKVAYFNEAQSLAAKLRLDWQVVMAGIMSDGRIAQSHTQVPGPDGKYGFGGACLPKDIANLSDCFNKAGIPHFIINSTMSRNVLDRDR